MKSMRAYLITGFLLFLVAALIHAGIAGERFRHREALIAESIIAAVLLTGWTTSVLAPPRMRPVAIAVQAFGLFGTAIGLVTIAIGVGPRSPLDLVLHGLMILLLGAGLVTALRAGRAV